MIPKQKIIDIYTNLDISYYTEGKNVTSGWVEVQCPFCADSSHHCGVNHSTELFNCWICGRKGHFVDLLMELTGLSFAACKSLVIESTATFREPVVDTIRHTFEEKLSEPELSSDVEVELPKRFELITCDTNSSLLDAYLQRRNFTRALLMDHKCGICKSGPYMHRLIAPVFYQGKLVSFQAADMTGFGSLPYRAAPLSMGRINDYLYGYDEIDKIMIVVEGLTDKWRAGKESVAAFTSHLTPSQRELIKKKELDELYFCFDPELTAYFKSREEAEEFRAYVPKVEVLRLPYGKDPDKAGQEEIYRCMAETFV